jgi:uncharacterized protein YneF (UPF0154 family)
MERREHKDRRAGEPGKPGEEVQGGQGGTGGAGGVGGDPSGTGGLGGAGGSVYIDSRYVQRWVRVLGAAFVALAVAMIIGFWLIQKEHDHRVKDNTAAIALINSETKAHAKDDVREASAAILADCNRARDFRRIVIKNFSDKLTPQLQADLIEYVHHASRVGCKLKP